MKLNILSEIPERFLTVSLKTLSRVFTGPTLIELEGEIRKPLFISTLLHGNEHSGFYALQKLLTKYKNKLPRSLIIFIGNIEAATQNVRLVGDQVDFNRIWSGGQSEEEKIAQDVIKFCKARHIWASIDIHNNTGTNPYYSCVNKLEDPFLALASLFGETVIYFTEPHEVQSKAFAEVCPSVTLECGKSGDEKGVEVLVNYLEKVMHLHDLDEIEFNKERLKIFETEARIKLHPAADLDFEFNPTTEKDLSFPSDFDFLNFSTIPKGTCIGYTAGLTEHPLMVIDNNNYNIFSEYFKIEGKKIITEKHIFPSMFTKDQSVAKQDCLGYLMHKLNI